jgi:hypothetical protein
MKTECELYGRRITYDGCSTRSLESSIEFYSNFSQGSWIYIGSGYKIWYDGIENIGNKDLYHFFIKPDRKEEIEFFVNRKGNRIKKLKKIYGNRDKN